MQRTKNDLYNERQRVILIGVTQKFGAKMKRALTVSDLPVGTIIVHKTWLNAMETIPKQYIGIVYEQHVIGRFEERHVCVHYCDGDSEVFFHYEIPDNKMYILEVIHE